MPITHEEIIDGFREVLGRRGEGVVQVHGRSMLPLLWPGVRVHVRACKERDLVRGDLVLLIVNGAMVLHRYDGKGFRGDFRAQYDPSTAKVLARATGLIIGRMQFREFGGESIFRRYLVLPAVRRMQRVLPSIRQPLSRMKGWRKADVVRPLELDDRAAMRRFQLRRGLPVSKDWLMRLELALKGSGDQVFVAMKAGEIYGVVWLSPVGLVYDLWVERAFRGHGLASQLLGLLVSSNRERPLSALVAVSNLAAQRVFEHQGFIQKYNYERDWIRFERDVPAKNDEESRPFETKRWSEVRSLC